MARSFAALGAVLLALWTTPAFADRPVIHGERAKLTARANRAGLTAQGCHGAHMKVDDEIYEIDDARCANQRTYDF
jgi:hypothetical protein